RTMLVTHDGAISTIEGSAEISDLDKWSSEQGRPQYASRGAPAATVAAVATGACGAFICRFSQTGKMIGNPAA
ncbi:MAG: hypothetical protein E7B37_26170, partial [Bradyrhizobium sp.]|nr:hypothetical protein [Bradyrhizobium sp.]